MNRSVTVHFVGLRNLAGKEASVEYETDSAADEGVLRANAKYALTQLGVDEEHQDFVVVLKEFVWVSVGASGAWRCIVHACACICMSPSWAQQPPICPHFALSNPSMYQCSLLHVLFCVMRLWRPACTSWSNLSEPFPPPFSAPAGRRRRGCTTACHCASRRGPEDGGEPFGGAEEPTC